MKDSWLKPNGELIEVGQAKHNDYATDYLLNELGREGTESLLDKSNLSSPYEVLHNRGWIIVRFLHNQTVSIVGNCVNLTKLMRNTQDPAMNSAQMRVAKKLCRLTNTSLIDALNDKRFA